jgi:glutamate N-acetyltransferase/amino-acid N-acetyltransferase
MTDQPKLPRGFRTAGVHCGIKADTDRFDLALFVSDGPCAAAGTFTRNRVCGAPVKVSRERLPRASARAVVINSGNANACTGERGIEDARWMTAEVASRIGCHSDDVLVCSTGVIGRFLPREKLADGIPRVADALGGDADAFLAAARGMMTTDTFPKQAVRTIEVGGQTVTLSGAAKGAAMIAPNMATMLSVVMTDAALTPSEADRMLRRAVNQSFNCISVEGHTSTSDSVILLANGAAGVEIDSSTATFQEALDDLTAELAQSIIRDAEGAGHFITIEVSGLPTREDALRVAKAIAESPLVKTAVAGADPNWGRIISAAGYSGVPVEESRMALRLNGAAIYEYGSPTDHDPAAVSKTLRENRETRIELNCGSGNESVRFWTCDLTTEYVRLNSEYTT